MRSHAFRAAERLGTALLRLPSEAAAAISKPRQFWLTMTLVVPVAGTAGFLMPRLTLVMSPSIDAILLREAPGVIGHGDLVTFTLTHPLVGPKPVRVTKYALCLPGEHIDWLEKPNLGRLGTWDGWYFCEERLLGISKPVGHDGRRLDHWRPPYRIIPPGFVYVGSSHPSGFDSRYYGPVSASSLTKMEKLL